MIICKLDLWLRIASEVTTSRFKFSTIKKTVSIPKCLGLDKFKKISVSFFQTTWILFESLISYPISRSFFSTHLGLWFSSWSHSDEIRNQPPRVLAVWPFCSLGMCTGGDQARDLWHGKRARWQIWYAIL